MLPLKFDKDQNEMQVDGVFCSIFRFKLISPKFSIFVKISAKSDKNTKTAKDMKKLMYYATFKI